MRILISPRQAARAIGVSESTLKRWCDRGLIPTTKTAGGHRRMEISAVVRFLRESGRVPVEPALLELPAGTGATARSLMQVTQFLFQALTAGDEETARRLVFDLLLGGMSVASLCDDVLAPVFHRIGESWDCGTTEVYQERRACEICLLLLHEIREKVIPHVPGGPLALGAAPEKDHYTLPVAMAELVLRSLGWNATVLGSSLPSATLQQAISDCRPRLFWMSVSHIADEPRFISGANEVYRAAHAGGTAVIIGGRALCRRLREKIQFSVHGESFRDLERFARSLQPHDSQPTPPFDGGDDLPGGSDNPCTAAAYDSVDESSPETESSTRD